MLSLELPEWPTLTRQLVTELSVAVINVFQAEQVYLTRLVTCTVQHSCEKTSLSSLITQLVSTFALPTPLTVTSL